MTHLLLATLLACGQEPLPDTASADTATDTGADSASDTGTDTGADSADTGTAADSGTDPGESSFNATGTIDGVSASIVCDAAQITHANILNAGVRYVSVLCWDSDTPNNLAMQVGWNLTATATSTTCDYDNWVQPTEGATGDYWGCFETPADDYQLDVTTFDVGADDVVTMDGTFVLVGGDDDIDVDLSGDFHFVLPCTSGC